MSKKSKVEEKKKKTKHDDSPSISLSDKTKNTIYAIIAFVLALFFILAAFRGAGPAGNATRLALIYLFGVGFALLPFVAIILGFSFLKSKRPNIGVSHTISSGLFLLSGLSLIDIAFGSGAGGVIGHAVAWPFLKLFDVAASAILLSGIFLVSIIILFDAFPNIIEKIKSWWQYFFGEKMPVDDEEPEVNGLANEEEVESEEDEEPESEPVADKPRKSKKSEEESAEEEIDAQLKTKNYKPKTSYVPPPLSLLEADSGKPNTGDIKANANIIKRTLENFGIIVEMDEITVGPTVTRYALKPAEGVKLSRIVGLQNDLALALAAHPIRIEAPIPGKSLVGIEIPNKTKSVVGLGTMLGDNSFKNSSHSLGVAIGRDVTGKAHFGDISKMPHALIAGTTGSGKSVTIHSIITSLLYKNGPEEMKFIFVDPKRVELTLYNKIPHLLTPVITEAKKCILALKWAAKEMDRRYDILQAESVRDIASYHSTIVAPWKPTKDKEGVELIGPDPMPYIVIIIDELADIMQSYPRELESAIVRLAQMSRAVGIHLILSTQRPEVNVITGLIKANVPTRVALRVPTQVDSRTILDSAGAEKLLGYGDMLYSDGNGQPRRLQSAFISESEVKSVVKYLINQFKDEIQDELNLTGGAIGADNSIFNASMDDDSNNEDEFYEEARSIVIETGKASTSFLQRKLGVGYARAARLIDMLEERGIVGPGNGAKPREVLEGKAEGEEKRSSEYGARSTE